VGVLATLAHRLDQRKVGVGAMSTHRRECVAPTSAAGAAARNKLLYFSTSSDRGGLTHHRFESRGRDAPIRRRPPGWRTAQAPALGRVDRPGFSWETP
jgi:hypothetical protein